MDALLWRMYGEIFIHQRQSDKPRCESVFCEYTDYSALYHDQSSSLASIYDTNMICVMINKKRTFIYYAHSQNN